MTELIAFLDFLLLLMDVLLIDALRHLLFDFLVGQRNRKSMRAIHKSQPLKERVTLSYIGPMLKRYVSEFKFYHALYLTVLFSTLPQYVLLVVLHATLGEKSRYALYVLLGIKAILSLFLRLQVDPLMNSKETLIKSAL